MRTVDWMTDRFEAAVAEPQRELTMLTRLRPCVGRSLDRLRRMSQVLFGRLSAADQPLGLTTAGVTMNSRAAANDSDKRMLASGNSNRLGKIWVDAFSP